MNSLKHRPLLKDRVHSELLEMIQASRLKSGDRLPAETQLAQQLNCTRQTLRQALKILEQDNLIVRRKGSGTYLQRQPSESSQLVGVMVNATGHVYTELNHLLASRLQEHAWVPTMLALGRTPEKAAETVKPLVRLLHMGCRHLVLQPSALDYPAMREVLDEAEEKLDQLVWMAGATIMPCDIPGDTISVDTTASFVHTLRHLHELGHRRVALYSFRTGQLQVDNYGTHWYTAIQQTGPWERTDVVHMNEDETKGLSAILQQPNRPTAIVANSDSWAIQATRIATELGLEVPRDLSITGAYDTPWSQEYDITTTTHENAAQVDALCELLAMPHISGRRRQILVQPQLIVRGSTAVATP